MSPQESGSVDWTSAKACLRFLAAIFASHDIDLDFDAVAQLYGRDVDAETIRTKALVVRRHAEKLRPGQTMPPMTEESVTGTVAKGPRQSSENHTSLKRKPTTSQDSPLRKDKTKKLKKAKAQSQATYLDSDLAIVLGKTCHDEVRSSTSSRETAKAMMYTQAWQPTDSNIRPGFKSGKSSHSEPGTSGEHRPSADLQPKTSTRVSASASVSFSNKHKMFRDTSAVQKAASKSCDERSKRRQRIEEEYFGETPSLHSPLPHTPPSAQADTWATGLTREAPSRRTSPKLLGHDASFTTAPTNISSFGSRMQASLSSMTSMQSSGNTPSQRSSKKSRGITVASSTSSSGDRPSSSSACPEASQMSLSGLSPWHERGIHHPWFDKGVDSPETKARKRPPLVYMPGTQVAKRLDDSASNGGSEQEASGEGEEWEVEETASGDMRWRVSHQQGKETWEVEPEIEETGSERDEADMFDMQSQEQLEAELHSVWH